MRKVLRPLTSISATCLLLLLSHGALASNESLTFRRATNGHIEAVVSGLDDGPGCLLLEFTAPLPVTITGNTIVITNRHGDATCVRNDSGTGGSRDRKGYAAQRLPADAPTTARR
jgi:hypothetical protein